MSEELFDWPEHGQRLTIGQTLDGAVVVTVADDTGQATAELSRHGVEALIAAVDELAGGRGWTPEITHEAVLEELDAVENERDEAIARADKAEAQARELLTTVEQLKSALDLADQRLQAAERTLVECHDERDIARAERDRARADARELEADLA